MSSEKVYFTPSKDYKLSPNLSSAVVALVARAINLDWTAMCNNSNIEKILIIIKAK